MRRLSFVPVWILALSVIAAGTASAQQSFSLSLGGFTPHSLDNRGNDDVLFKDSAFFATLNRDRGIDISRFNGFTLGGEYLVGLGDRAEAGLGIGIYQRTVPVVDADFTNANGSEVFADFKLRIVPLTATVRFLPLGHNAAFQPYIGAGVGVFMWRYSETGDFVSTNNTIINGNYVGSGSEAGPVVLGGARIPIGAAAIGGEIRWQSAKATLPSDQGFAGSKLDLGGFNYLFTMNFRF